MSQMANITVKKADNTTDVVYTALTPSAGDRVAAKWRSNSTSSIPGNRPVFSMVTRDNGNANARRVVLSGNFPILQTVAGVESVVANTPFELTMAIPQNADTVQVTEAVVQFTNLAVAALIRSSMIDGYAPT